MKRFAVVFVTICLGAAFIVIAPTTRASAQGGYMPIGLIEPPQLVSGGCSALTPSRGFAISATCYITVVTACNTDDDLALIYGVSSPTDGMNKGTIVLFSGLGGGIATLDNDLNNSYTAQYTANGYQVVEVAWGGTSGPVDWEYTHHDRVTAPSIRNASCRPATFLHWVRFGNTYNGTFVPGLWTTNGMCAQGFSAGAAALAYSMAWYGAADSTTGYLDKVELLSGPELADIEQGCQIPQNTGVTMCPQGQLGCVGWINGPGGEPFVNSPEFTQQANDVEMWSGGTQNTGTATCANNSNNTTTYNTQWLQMSIVDSTSTQQPSFNYPKTMMTGWLCETTAGNAPSNNSGAQGEIFYKQFTSTSQLLDKTGQYAVNAVTGCPSAEDVNDGTPPSGTMQTTGFAAVWYDMAMNANSCTRNQGH